MLSAVIPAFSADQGLAEIALKTAESIRPQVQELVISDDGDRYWPELHRVSDIYLIHPRLGYTKNSNLGWRVASGDYVIQVNSDAVLTEGDLTDLCIPDTIASPWFPSAGQGGFSYTVSG